MRQREPTRRLFLQSAGRVLLTIGSVARRVEPVAAQSFDIFEKSIRDLQAAMTARQLTSVQLVQFYLDRIAAYDQAGPGLNSVLYVNPNALANARALDAERRRRGPRGPLHGIPVLLKDNFDTMDMPTTGGALALSGIVPKADAFQVKKLRQAGVVILGKVNLHELALGLTTISSLGGQTLDPYDLTRAPGGFQRWLRRRRRRQLRDVRHGDRHERFHSNTQLSQLHRRPEAICGSFESSGHHPVRPHTGFRGADGPNGRGHRDHP